MSSSKIVVQDREVSISSLAQEISSLSSKVSSYLAANKFPEPNFAVDASLVPETPEYEALRAPLNEAALDLLRLINGPKNTLRIFFFSHYDFAALQVALERRLFEHVPLPSAGAVDEDGTPIAEIAEKAKMDEDRAGRVMKLLATHRIFEEVGERGGRFRHTASSAVLLRDADFRANGAMQTDEMFQAASETSALIRRSPYESSALHSAFAHRLGSPIYQYYEQHPEKGTRFAQVMRGWSQTDRQVSELCATFPWESLQDGKVVDIGGGSGHISIALAHKFPRLHFIVQDLSSHQLSQAPEDLAGRVTFQQHDFFYPQPVRDASAFLLRQCLHNHNDTDAVRILRGVVPALEACGPGTPLLINSIVMPERGTLTRFEEHQLRQADLCMMVVLGAKQRSEAEFRALLKEADDRLEITNVRENPLGVGVLEVRLIEG